ncbi:uncharacterized protein LOC134227197 isoform X2 [Armigeres subalbatus]|uniref:uncharacterized protein LOC134227197 isoform X2 n=1 Tax=Armigeres subalbatus TaxID=124917 RepID=UPI002ED683E7
MKISMLLLMAAIILIANECFGQRTTPRSASSGKVPTTRRQTTPSRTTQRHTTRPAGQAAKLVSANQNRPTTRTTRRATTRASAPSANVNKLSGAGVGATIRTTPRRQTTRSGVGAGHSANMVKPSGAGATSQGKQTTRTTARSVTSRTTTKVARQPVAVAVSVPVGRPTDKQTPTKKPTETSTYLTKVPQTAWKPYSLTTGAVGYSLPFAYSSYSIYSSYSNSTDTGNATTYAPSWPMDIASSTVSSVNSDGALYEYSEEHDWEEYGTSEPNLGNYLDTAEEVGQDTTTPVVTKDTDQTGPTRKKLKRRIRIDPITGKRQVMKRRKVVKQIVENKQ